MTSGASHVPTPDFTLWASGNELIYPLGHLAGPRGCPEDSLSSYPLMLTPLLHSGGDHDYPTIAEDTMTQRPAICPKAYSLPTMGFETGLCGSSVPLALRLWKLITGLREAPSGSKCYPGNVTDSEELSFLPDPRAQDSEGQTQPTCP